MNGKKRSGNSIDGGDIFTECVLLYLTGNVRTAKKQAQKLPGRLRADAESIISGNSMSVKDVFQDPEENTKERR